MKHLSPIPLQTAPIFSIRFRTSTATAALYLVLVCLLMGCDSDDDADSDKKGRGNRSAAQDCGTEEPEPAEEGISISWKVTGIGGEWTTLPGLNGVKVCLIESIDMPCVTTDEDGVFVLKGVPVNDELLLTFEKEGYRSVLVSVKTGTRNIIGADAVPQFMSEVRGLVDEFDPLGVVIDNNKGEIVIWASNSAGTGGIPGRLSVSIDPPAGEGPFFLGAINDIVPDATGLSEEISGALFENLDEGEYLVRWQVEGPEEISCHPLGVYYNVYRTGLPAREPDAMRVNVRAGFSSGLNIIICNPVAEPDADAGI